MPGRDELDEIKARDPEPDYGVSPLIIAAVWLVLALGIFGIVLFLRDIR